MDEFEDEVSEGLDCVSISILETWLVGGREAYKVEVCLSLVASQLLQTVITLYSALTGLALTSVSGA